jgi:hypothetical protein
MNITPVSDLVHSWQEKLTVISRNIAELTETEAAKRIRNRMRGAAQPVYAGLTQEKSREAFKAVESLLADFLLLDSVVSGAASLHARSNIFRNTDAEVRELLEGASVRLPSIQVPLRQRGLLDAAVQADAARPEELLEAMLDSFDRANQIIGEIDQAEAGNDIRLAGAQAEAEALRAWSDKLGFVAKADALDDLKGAESDPLQAAATLASLEGRFNDWRRELEEAERAQAAIRVRVDHGREMLAQLEDLASRSRLAIEETNRSIAGRHSYLEPASREALDAHAVWLANLENLVTSGRWKAAQVGLQSFESSLKARMETELKTYTHNRKALDEVAELKGRYQALKAKAKAYAERGDQPGAAMPGIKTNIDEVLSQALVDVQRLRQLVGAFDTTLKGNGK